MTIEKIKHNWEKYLGCCDVEYAHDVAMRLHPMVNADLGGRNAGSDAEHRAAEMLFKEMLNIGLGDVRKEWFPVVKWQFNDCTLRVMSEKHHEKIQFKPYAYPAGGTPAEGVTGELVYANRGTKQDLMDTDIRGRILLIDIDMREDWWVTYPVLEAALRGASAVVCSCIGGFSMENDTAMNCQDFVGPQTIPCVSISRKEADHLKKLMTGQKVMINLWVDAQLDLKGKSCNLTGIIPGKNTEEQLIVGDHYDCHFWGFQDNNMAVGLTLAIAKAIIDAKILPERTLVFILHGAEESGALDTRYDWSVGAWNQINHIRPEWVGRTLAYINFELPGYEFGNTNYTAAAPELFGLLQRFQQALPEALRAFRGDPYETGFPQFSWSDDWSYTAAGVPGMVNGFLQNKKGFVNDFFITKYHSQFDHPDTYDEEMLAYHLKLYGCLALFLVGQPYWLLDDSTRINQMKKSVDEKVRAYFPLEARQLQLALDDLKQSSEKMIKSLELLNEQTLKSNHILNAASQSVVNQYMLHIFKRWQDLFLRLDWSDTPIVGHQHYKVNCTQLEEALTHLENSQGEAALESLCLIEDEHISRFFSKEVVNHFTNQVMSPDRKDNQYWGAKRIVDSLDLFHVVNSIQDNIRNAETKNWQGEIDQLQKHLEEQKNGLKKALLHELQGLNEMQLLYDDMVFERHINRLLTEPGLKEK